MEIDYNTQMISARMCLDDALRSFPGEIAYLTLRDGTNIEIIPPVNHPETSYMDNQLQYVNQNTDEFVEEKVDANMYNMNYNQVLPKQPGPLRGRGKVKGKTNLKTLRKTVLKSIDGSEQEKKNGDQKLRNLKDVQKNQNLNEIISFSENNDFLQCANCFKFFVSDEKEKEDKPSTQKSEQNVQNKTQQTPQQKNQQQFPGQPQYPPKKKDINKYPQQQQQPYPQQSPGFINYPQQHQKYPTNMNMNMGFPQRPNQPQQFYPQHNLPNMPGKHNQKQQQQFYNQKNIPGFFPGPGPMNTPMNQFRGGQNQVFRARKKEMDYDEEFDDYDVMENNYVMEQQNYPNYPVSAKKVNYNKINYGEYPLKKHTSHNVERKIVPRNLSQGLKKSISTRREIGYTDNNLTEFIAENDDGSYYQYSYYQKNNLIPSPRTKKANNHRCVNVKVTRNIPYQYQEYQDYQEDYDVY